MRRGAIIAIVVGVVVAAVGAGVAWWLLRPPSAEDAAQRYLSALSTGDVAVIDAMRGSSDPEVDRLVDDAFSGAKAYLSDARIDELASSGDRTVVRASAEFDGERRDLRFTLASEADGFVLTGDHLGALTARSIATATAEPMGDSVWVGNALMPTDVKVGLLPAVYEVAAAPSVLLEGEGSVVIAAEPVELTIEATLTEAAGTAAQEQLDQYARTCAQRAVAVPEDCGIRVPWAADLTQLDAIAFRIEKFPAVSFDANGRTFGATGGVIVATATGLAWTGMPASFTYRAEGWALRGSVSFEGDEMVLAVG